jgi:ATP-binding cassette, subfamily C, bacterial exporter for protease/lipase
MPKTDASRTELQTILGAFRGALAAVGAFSLVINLIMLAPAIYMLQIYERVLMSRNATTLWVITGIVLGLYALMAMLELVRSLVLIRVSARLDMALNVRLFTATFEQRLRQGRGNPGQVLGDLTTVRQFLTGSGLFAFFDAPWTPIFILVITALSPTLGVLSLCGALILFALAWATETATRKPMTEANLMAFNSSQFAGNNLRNAEVIEAMGMLDHLITRWFRIQRRMIGFQSQASERAAVISSMTRFVRVALQSLILGVGALLAIEGEITPGAMVAASILMGRALAPVEQAIGVWKQLLAARSAYHRLNTLLIDFPPREVPMSLPAPKGELMVENVVAAPPGAKQMVLKGISIQARPGEILGIIGPSASGKSTLARLIVGLWPAQNGKVRLDGADVFTWNKTELGSHIGYLPQDIELFDGTVAENIARFGEIDSDRVVEAAKLAGVHEMVLRFPQGYDMPIGESGNALSAGQRQRIGLARALYGNPALLVLDEPNSNLDDTGENALILAVRTLKQQGRCVVLITHRPRILSDVDKLLLLVDGVMQAYGPRDEVLKFMQERRVGAAASPS